MNGYQYLGLFLGAFGLIQLLIGASMAATGIWEGLWIGYIVVGIFFVIGGVTMLTYGASKQSEARSGIEDTKQLLKRLEKKDEETNVY